MDSEKSPDEKTSLTKKDLKGEMSSDDVDEIN